MERACLPAALPAGGGVQTEAHVYDENGKRVLDENGQPVTQQVTERAQAAMVTLTTTAARAPWWAGWMKRGGQPRV